MGYNPPPPPLPYPMTRKSVPPPPPPPPPKRIINEGWPSITKPKKKNKEMKLEVLDRYYCEGDTVIIRYGNDDKSFTMKVGRHGKLDDVMGEELDAINALLDHAEQQKIEKQKQKAKLDEDVEKQKMAQEFYSPYVPLILEESKKYSKQVDSHREQLKTLTASMKEKIVNDKLLEENRRLAGISDTQFKKSADLDSPKKKEKQTVKPEPKPEYGEVLTTRKKKSFWDRLTDRIIKNIVWGK